MSGTRTGLEELDALRLQVLRSSDMLCRHEPDGTYVVVSTAARDLVGHEPEDLVGRSAYEFIHPDDRAQVRSTHERVLAGAGVESVEYRFRHRDGSWVWLETTSQSVREGDDVAEIHTASRDVTARKQAEGRLRESEERFRLSMGNAPIGIALVGTDGSWLEVNDRLCEIVGRSRDELLALTFQDITHPDDLDADLAYVQALLDGEMDRYAMEKRYFHADGREVPILLSVSLVRDAAGEPLHFISQIQDISERRRAEEERDRFMAELLRSNAELERFAMVASHDLRSPLTTVRTMLLVIQDLGRDAVTPQLADLLERCGNNVDRLLETVDALLELARLQGTADAVQPTPVGEVLDKLAADLSTEIASVGAVVESHDLPVVEVDPARLRVVLQNLLGNAIKYRHPDRRLRVRVAGRVDGDVAEVVVEDNGRGFEPEDREIMFQPFGRTSSGDKVEGAGIGLATCRRIVESYGGTITADPLGEGARFTITLPLAP